MEQDQSAISKEGLRGAKIAACDNVIGRHREGKVRFLEIAEKEQAQA